MELTREVLRQIYDRVPVEGVEEVARELSIRPEEVFEVVMGLRERGVYLLDWLNQMHDRALKLLLDSGENNLTYETAREIIEVIIKDDLLDAFTERVYLSYLEHVKGGCNHE